MTGALVRYDAMCRAIEAAHEIDEVQDIRDQALALEYYARQAVNTDAERKAIEIRLRAERKVGQLLARTEKAKRGPDKATGQRSQRTTSDDAPTLADLGITKDQSSQWQKLGAMSQHDFDLAIGTAVLPPSTKGVLRTVEEPKPRCFVTDEALWLWGRLMDFERDGLLEKKPIDVMETLTALMKDDVHRLAPKVAAWLKQIGAMR